MTTINNLQLHISWLLQTKPHRPPAATLPAERALPTTLQQPHSSTTSSSAAFDDGIVDLPGNHVRLQSVDSRLRSSTEDDRSGKMARLRAPPSIHLTPKLLSRRPALSPHESDKDAPRLPNTSSARVPPPANQRHGDAPKAAETPRTNPAIRRLFHDADSIDLSGPEIVANDHSTASRPTQKRKSDEHRAGSREACLSPRAKKLRTTPEHCRSDDTEFTAIDDFDDPPPPYSSPRREVPQPFVNSHTDRNVSARPTGGQFGQSDDEVEEYSITETIRTETRFRRASSRPISALPSKRSPTKPAVTRCSETPKKAARPAPSTNHAFLYSDDMSDDFDATDIGSHFQAPNEHELSPSIPKARNDFTFHNHPASLGQSLLPQSGQTKASAETASQQVPASSSLQRKPAQSQPPSKAPTATPLAIRSPTKPSQSTPSELSEAQKQFVKASLAWSDAKLQAQQQTIQADISQNRQDWYEAESNEQPVDEINLRKKILKGQEDAIRQLLDLRAAHRPKTIRKEELRVVMMRLFDEASSAAGVDDEVKAQNIIITREIRDIEQAMHRCLVEADLIATSDAPADVQKDPGHIMVRSTQTTPLEMTTDSARMNAIFDAADAIEQTPLPTSAARNASRNYNATHNVNQDQYLNNRSDTRHNFDLPRSRNPNQTGNQTLPRSRISPREDQFDFRPESSMPKMPTNNFHSGVNSRHGNSRDTRSAAFSKHHDLEHEFSDDGTFPESLFTNRMGTPPVQVDADEEFDDSDDDGLLEAMNHSENKQIEQVKSKAAEQSRSVRNAFTEIYGNRQLRADSAVSAKKRVASRASWRSQPGMDHPWSDDVATSLTEKFNLKGFRPNQLEAINTTLSGNNAFVLMPTGGGKSLCYQLPATVCSGKTSGITIVVSPLLSLMQDQVSHLRKLEINAVHYSSAVEKTIKDQIMRELRGPDPLAFIELLYLSPEMLSLSGAMGSVIDSLHRRGILARIVIDEAHCVSQWGHDFRPDYKKMAEKLRDFRGVPLMALTATATKLIKEDVKQQLGIKGCAEMVQSFNRPNLIYDVRTKGTDTACLDDIMDLIKERYAGKCGIIYCLSKKMCEEVAKSLQTAGLKAAHYHASVDAKDKAKIQEHWQQGRTHIIVATIAFGMGIDKANVRFVIHHSVPKSLEGYYQETGRAGRDGKMSECFLFYRWSDCGTLLKMIENGDGDNDQKSRQKTALRHIIHYCLNRTDCRRVQVLKYFSENFDRRECNDCCDNCQRKDQYEPKDVTSLAASAVNMVAEVEGRNVTVLQCADILHGDRSQKVKTYNFDQLDDFGRASSMNRSDCERLFHKLVVDGALELKLVKGGGGFPIEIVTRGPHAYSYEQRRERVTLDVRVSNSPKRKAPTKASSSRGAAKKAKTTTGVAASKAGQPASTNVPSPHQKGLRGKGSRLPQRGQNAQGSFSQDSEDAFMVPDDDLDSQGFGLIREQGKPRNARKRQLGPPITSDEQMSRLQDTQRDIVEESVDRAKKKCRDLLMRDGLRAEPFSVTVLRNMFIDMPNDKNELTRIEGIDPSMANAYGDAFLPLIRECRAHCHDALGDSFAPGRFSAGHGRKANRGKSRTVVSDDDDDDNDEEYMPHDPNHRNVIDLIDLTSAEEDSSGRPGKRNGRPGATDERAQAFKALMDASQRYASPQGQASNESDEGPSAHGEAVDDDDDAGSRSTRGAKRGGRGRGRKGSSGAPRSFRKSPARYSRRGSSKKGSRGCGSSRGGSGRGASSSNAIGGNGIGLMPTHR